MNNINPKSENFFPSLIKLGTLITLKRHEIYDLLISYESKETIEDELFKSLDCISNIAKEYDDLTAIKVKQIAVLLPVNLPLYSLILFGAIPSYMSEHTLVRPPHAMNSVIKQLFTLLNFGDLFAGLELLENIDRDTFRTTIAPASDVVIFTGSHRNALKVQAALPKSTLFLQNGAGLNPLVICSDADLDLAVEKTLHVKLFNSGQDCAGPDTILVHKSIIKAFQQKLIERLRTVNIDISYENGAQLGPLIEQSYLPLLSDFLVKESPFIDYGGTIDFAHQVVYPTIITKPLTSGTNYSELFAPIFYLSVFDNDLADYFDNELYRNHAMYVSIFGTLKDKDFITHSQILHEQDVITHERGNSAYGGYGLYASYVTYMGRKTPKPILISREVAAAFS